MKLNNNDEQLTPNELSILYFIQRCGKTSLNILVDFLYLPRTEVERVLYVLLDRNLIEEVEHQNYQIVDYGEPII